LHLLVDDLHLDSEIGEKGNTGSLDVIFSDSGPWRPKPLVAGREPSYARAQL